MNHCSHSRTTPSSYCLKNIPLTFRQQQTFCLKVSWPFLWLSRPRNVGRGCVGQFICKIGFRNSYHYSVIDYFNCKYLLFLLFLPSDQNKNVNWLKNWIFMQLKSFGGGVRYQILKWVFQNWLELVTSRVRNKFPSLTMTHSLNFENDSIRKILNMDLEFGMLVRLE